jgi:hypothetical protein
VVGRVDRLHRETQISARPLTTGLRLDDLVIGAIREEGFENGHIHLVAAAVGAVNANHRTARKGQIADGVEVSPFTLVTRSIHERGKVTGYMPVQAHDRWLQNAAQVRHLARMADRIKELEARLSALESNTGNGRSGDRAGMEGE